jgi:ATP-dependent DNA ligase
MNVSAMTRLVSTFPEAFRALVIFSGRILSSFPNRAVITFMLRMRTLPAGFIAPCLPTKTDKLPSGDGWLHEIKHDGCRIIARKNGARG